MKEKTADEIKDKKIKAQILADKLNDILPLIDGFMNSLDDEDFELIEDKIDIDSIEELDKCKFGHGNTISYQESKFIDKVNELVQAVKKLDKEIKNIKEK